MEMITTGNIAESREYYLKSAHGYVIII